MSDIKTQIQKEAEKRVPILTEEEYYKDDVDDPYYDYRVLRQYQQLLFREGAEWLHTEVVLPLQKELKDEEKMKLQWVDMYNKEYQLTKSLQSQLSLSEGRVKELEARLKEIEGALDD